MLLVLFGLPPACQKKPGDNPDAGPKDAAPKPVPVPPVETPPSDLLAGVPELPGQLGLRLGDTVAALRAARPEATVDPLTPAIFTEDLKLEGPFSLGTYLLGRTGPNAGKVETIILTLQPEYRHPEHWQALEKAIADKFGAGRPTEHTGFKGLEWALPGQRIELRRDTRRDDEPELVFDLRGGREIELP